MMGFPMPWGCACFGAEQPKRRRPRIDRSMIGQPTDFQHTGHIGTGDMGNTISLREVQSSMHSKGGHTTGAALPTTLSPAARAIPLDQAAKRLSRMTTADEQEAQQQLQQPACDVEQVQG